MDQPVRKIEEMLGEIQDNVLIAVVEEDTKVDQQMVDVIAEAMDEIGYPAEDILKFKREMKED